MRSLLVFAFMFLVLFAHAQYLLEEDFNFAGDAVAGVNDWIHQSGTANFMQTISPGLVFPNYPGSGVGKAVQVNGVGGEDVYKKFQTRTKLYYSFMIKVVPATNTPKTGYVTFLGKEQGTGVNGGLNGNYFARILIRSIGDGTWKIGTSNWSITNVDNPVIYSSNVFQNDRVYAVVIAFDMADNYKISIWVKEDSFPLAEKDAGLPDVVFMNAPNLPALPTSIDVIGLRQDVSSPSVIMDGLRVFDNWGSYILPLKLLSFDAQRENQNSILLKWEATSSVNVNRFDIEKSKDAKTFQYVSSVNCINKSDLVSYSCKDYSVSVEDVFYRLKIIDFDGKYVYSSVATIKRTPTASVKIGSLGGRKIKVFLPEMMNVRGIKIFDFDGILRKDISNIGISPTEINLSELPVGNYILQIEHSKSTISQKFVLQ